MRKQQIIEAMNNGAQLAYNMIEVKHQLHFNDEVYTVRANTALSIKKELDLVPVKQSYHNRSKADVMIVRNNTYMSQDEIKGRLEEVKKSFSVGETVILKDNKCFNEIILKAIKDGKKVTAEIEHIYDDGSMELINIKENGNLIYWTHCDRKLDQATNKDVENFIDKEVIEVKFEEVKQTGANTFEYKGKKVSVYGKADECNNMAIEGWLYLIPNYEEEYSTIYAEGYNTYKEAVKAVIDDSFRRYGNKFDIEEISFI